MPTFPESGAVGGPTGSSGLVDAGIPDDCERVMPSGDLVALLGLPLGSVAVRTTVGIPEPSVGRVERVACRYTGTLGRVKGVPLLEINAGRYVDGASASRQWRTNAAAESGARRDMPVGAAPGVLIERPDEALLTVVHADVAVTMVLPAAAPKAPGRTAPDTLTDLARRVLATAAPSPPPAGESVASG